jgi:hypothetical protein
MIMQDAHNLFFEDLSFAGRIWKIPFTMDELCVSGAIKGMCAFYETVFINLAETIIVAITPIKREYEYVLILTVHTNPQ